MHTRSEFLSESAPLLAKNGQETYICDTAPRDVSFRLRRTP